MPVRTGPITRDASTVAVGLAQIRVGNSAANIANANPVLTASHSIGALADTKLTSSVEFWKLESGFPAQEDLSIPIKETVSLECSFKEITPKTIALARGIDPTSGGSTVTAMGFTVFKSAAGTYDSGKIITCETTCPQDTFSVKFTSASAYTVEGFASGPLTGSGTVAGASTFQLNAALQITIPASYFTGTWANGDVFRFSTVKSAYDQAHSGSIGLGGMSAPAYVRMEAYYTFPNGVNHMHIIFPRANVTSSMEIAFNASDNAAPAITFESKGASSDVSGGNAVWDTMSLGRILFD